MDRRELLAKTGAVAGMAALAGCSLTPFDCRPAHEITIDPSEASLTESRRENLSIIALNELPSEEREIAREAIRNDEYVECYPGSEALQSFVERVENRIAEQFESYEGTPPEYLNAVYVREGDAYYALSVTVEDEVISDP